MQLIIAITYRNIDVHPSTEGEMVVVWAQSKIKERASTIENIEIVPSMCSLCLGLV